MGTKHFRRRVNCISNNFEFEAGELDRYGRTIRQTTFAYRDNGLLWSETRTGIDTGLREEVKLFDVVLGIYFAQHRFYDPNLRRFLSVDPIKDGHNWYAYCANNPVTHIDPYGLYWIRFDNRTGIFTLMPYGRRHAIGDVVMSLFPVGSGTGVLWSIRADTYETGVGNMPTATEAVKNLITTITVDYYQKLACNALGPAGPIAIVALKGLSVANKMLSSADKVILDEIAFRLIRGAGLPTQSRSLEVLIDRIERTHEYIISNSVYFHNPLEDHPSFNELFEYQTRTQPQRMGERATYSTRNHHPLRDMGRFGSLYDFDRSYVSNSALTRGNFISAIEWYMDMISQDYDTRRTILRVINGT